jgi:DNA-binding NarL/FixJ family response regulator
VKILQHDAASQTSIEREATPDEIVIAAAALEEMENQAAVFQAQLDTRQSALSKLAALGLTNDEINALVG